MRKSILSLALAVILNLAAAPAAYADGAQTGVFRYNFKDSGAAYSAFFEVTNAAGVWKSSLTSDTFPATQVFVSAPATVKLLRVTDATGAEIKDYTWKLVGTDGDTDPSFMNHIRAGDYLGYDDAKASEFSTELKAGSSYDMKHGTRVFLFNSDKSDWDDGFIVWAFDAERTQKLASKIPGGSLPIPKDSGGSAPSAVPAPQPAPAGRIVSPTASTVYVNGQPKSFEAYTIDGNNYFKLRDLAFVLNGTSKQFDIGFDNGTKAITLTSGEPYTAAGGEMAKGDGKAKQAAMTASKIYLNGKELKLTVYTIGGNNFFKLRDLMEALDVSVGYDDATKAITLDTGEAYAAYAAEPNAAEAEKEEPSAAANPSEFVIVNSSTGDMTIIKITNGSAYSNISGNMSGSKGGSLNGLTYTKASGSNDIVVTYNGVTKTVSPGQTITIGR